MAAIVSRSWCTSMNARCATASAGRCELEDGPAHCRSRRHGACRCDASIITITEDERGEPLDVGRKTRSIPPALRRALASRDKGCVFPGCSSQALRRRSPHPALGRGRRDETLEPGHAVPVPSPRGARRRPESRPLRRRRVALHQQARASDVRLRAGAHATAGRLDATAGRACRARHRDQRAYRGHALAWRTHGLRSCDRFVAVQGSG